MLKINMHFFVFCAIADARACLSAASIVTGEGRVLCDSDHQQNREHATVFIVTR